MNTPLGYAPCMYCLSLVKFNANCAYIISRPNYRFGYQQRVYSNTLLTLSLGHLPLRLLDIFFIQHSLGPFKDFNVGLQ